MNARQVVFNLASAAILVVVNVMVLGLLAVMHAPKASVIVIVGGANVLLIAALSALKVVAVRLEHDISRLERRYQSLSLVSTDRAMETDVLETLSDVSTAFLERMELQPLLERMSEAVQSILKVDVSVIELLPEPEGERTTFVQGTDRLLFGDQLYDEVVGRGKSLLINDLTQYPGHVSLSEQGLQAMIVAPLNLRSRVIGFVGAFARGTAGFSSRELRLLYTFANHAALLIETTQLLDAVRKLSLKTGPEMITDLRGLKDRLSTERAMADQEMAVARKIQTDLLPKEFPDIPGLHVEAANLPAKEVAGDYYDFIDLADGRWGIAIADVSGKGVPAALVMVMSRTLLRSIARQHDSPRDVLAALNATLYEETDPRMFVSMLYGVWDGRSHRFVYANAGHERPLLLRPGADACEKLTTGGIALGAVPDGGDTLEDRTIDLPPGELLVLYTDGVTEAMDARWAMFGAQRLEQAICSARDGTVDAITSSIDSFIGNASRHDDITIVTMRSR